MSFTFASWNWIRILSVILVSWVLFLPPLWAGEEPVTLGFETAEQWKQWKSITFPNRKQTRYEFDPTRGVVCGYANGSASGKAREFPGNLEHYPIMEWEWKIDHVLEKGKAQTNQGEDYAARLFVNFERVSSLEWWNSLKTGAFETLFGQEIPGSSLNFIWANTSQSDRTLPDALTDRARLIVARSGNRRAGKWVRERVNIAGAYRRSFGRAPPPVQSVAIMTDADNTQSEAKGCYRNIRLLPDTDDISTDHGS